MLYPRLSTLWVLFFVLSGLSTLGCMPGLDHEEDFSFDEPVDTLVVRLDAGDVDVSARPGDRVEVHAEFYGEDLVLDRSLEGGVLTLSAEIDHCLNCHIDVTIELPPDVEALVDSDSGDIVINGIRGDVTATSSSGNVSASQITAELLELRTSSGNVRGRDIEALEVRLETNSGNVGMDDFVGVTLRMDTDSGNVRGDGINTEDIGAGTDSGNVEIGFDQAPDSARAVSSSGNVTVDLPSGCYNISAQTSSGNVRLNNVSHSDEAPQSLELRTSSGNVTVRGF